MDYSFIREDVDFYSKGTRCSAWLYLPETDKKCPVIVMAHGLGSVREMRFDEYAERFAAAGYACFLFDYRNFGASDGNKRQRIHVKEQLTDWEYAIHFIKKDKRILNNQILLFGSSFSGGHTITLSAKRKDITAAISQCPYTNSFATMRTLSLSSVLKMFPILTADVLSCVTGYHPVMLKLADERGKAAIMAVSDYKGFFRQVPENSNFINKTPARTLFEFVKYSPGKYTKKITSPIYYAVCKNDTLAPAKATLKCAGHSSNAVIKEYDCGHFDIYFDDYFEMAVKEYIRFFDRYTKC